MNENDRLQDADIVSHDVLGTQITVTSINRVLRLLDTWVGGKQDRYIVFRDVHGIMRARNESTLHEAHRKADLVVPDGVPVVWAARLSGVKGMSRVCGIDLLPAACERGVPLGWRHYFYGGGPGVAAKLAAQMAKKFPGISIVGTYCPPFRPLTPAEDATVSDTICAAAPDFLWVGLGTPKQELWMAEHRGRLGGAVLLGIGAAFDIHAGRISRAPLWLQNGGLEWAYRMAKEPRRLWRRYLLLAPQFLILATFEAVNYRFRKLRFRMFRRGHG